MLRYGTEIEQLAIPPSRPSSSLEEGDGTLESIRLPGYDLWFTFIKTVHVVPTLLDCNNFIRALSDTLQIFRPVAGRLCRHGGDWTILLTDATIPVEIERRPSAQLQFKQPWVVQDDIAQYLHSQPAGDVTKDQPLLRMKLVLTNENTVIGVSWHHTLGDGTALIRFMQHLSQAYQGLPPLHPLPTFSKYYPSPPPAQLVENFKPMMPHLVHTYPLSQIGAQYAKMHHNLGRIDIRVNKDKLRRLRSRVLDKSPADDPADRVSTQDCLTAYIATVLDRCLDTPIRTVTNAASYRDVFAPFIDRDTLGNAIYVTRCSIESRECSPSLCEIAMALRQTLKQYRDPAFVEGWISVASLLMLSAANDDRGLFFASPPGSMSINAQAALDWHAAHFGFRGKTRFFTSGVNDRYLRVFRSNPVQSANGSWVDHGSDEMLDICFAVPSQFQVRVTEMIANEIGSPTFPDNIDITRRTCQ
ncbi:hypothetical protein B0H21DRAFT_285088 [Amylocystis lapponica]|nr:hypothetical protein B0H21DRAFT_285088 [Amylocystis lapponica]